MAWDCATCAAENPGRNQHCMQCGAAAPVAIPSRRSAGPSKAHTQHSPSHHTQRISHSPRSPVPQTDVRISSALRSWLDNIKLGEYVQQHMHTSLHHT